MRIVFVGAVAFSRRCLEETIAAGGEVVAVFTLEREQLRAHGDAADVGEVAAAAAIPLHRIANVNDAATIGLIRGYAPDAIFVFGWSQLLGPGLLELAPCIGSHPALLPRDRGRHPITWALVDGLEESGLTFLWLDALADSGDILWQRRFPIGADDDASDVYAVIERLAGEAIREFLPRLEAGTAPRLPQDESLATYRRRRTDADRWIDWQAPASAVHNLVRGLARPYVGALTRRGRQDVLVWRARPISSSPGRSVTPGAVVADDGGPVVQAADGRVVLLEVEPAGAVRVGDVLTGPA
jgi:methionyl-tRNA formyltransferase